MVKDRKAPDGYKITEIGIIPEDWSIHRIGDEIDSLNSGVSVNSHEGDVSSNNPGILKTSSVSKGKFIPSESKRIIKRDLSRVKLNPKYDSLIISRMNTPELVGECGYVDRDYPFLFIPDRLWQTNFKQNSIINCKWLSYVLSSNKYRRIIKDIATGTSNSMKNITKDEFLEIYVPYPNKIEQDAIAEALSDTDNLIQSVEKLINKKKKIKQGAMQQLLTGKKRLSGFSGEWEVKKLGEVADIRTGKRNNQDKVSDGLYPFFVRSQDVERINTYSYDGEAVLVPGEGGIGNIFHYINGKFEVHQRVYKISDFLNVSGKYVYYYMKQSFGAHAMKNTVKATVDSLRLPTFQEFELKIPNNLEEQKAIAQVLSDMDAEIEALEEKLEKVKTIKQGMMQELLTGRIRLI